MKINGILIDYGGTIDTGGNHWYRVFAEQYASAGIAVDDASLRAAYVYAERQLEQYGDLVKPSDTFMDVLQRKIAYQFEYLRQQQCGFHANGREQERLVMACNNFARRKVQESAKVLELLAKKYPLVLVSNFYGNLRSVINEYGITDYFSTVIESAQVGIRKPDPEIFKLGIQHLNVPAQEILVIGDSFKNDMAPAQLLDCKTAWLRGLGWELEDDSIAGQTADIIITGIEEILEILNINL
jgi:putative hydrolase of the HAD superfamily